MSHECVNLEPVIADAQKIGTQRYSLKYQTASLFRGKEHGLAVAEIPRLFVFGIQILRDQLAFTVYLELAVHPGNMCAYGIDGDVLFFCNELITQPV